MSADRGSRYETISAIALLVSLVASIALGVTYWAGGNTQLEGVFAALAFGGLAIGLALWARHLLPTDTVVEENEPTHASGEFADTLHEGTAHITRRRLLSRLLAAALTGLGAVALFPLRSLGPKPSGVPFPTRWTSGARLVTAGGDAVAAQTVPVGTMLTVFPEGHTDDVSSQTVLIRVDLLDLRAAPGREEWAPEGFVAYSKICTHAACPVGLYTPDLQQLFCPCHQSVFDVLDAARPLAGPAARALPQLPLAIDEDGYLVAQSDFAEPVGPSFWERG